MLHFIDISHWQDGIDLDMVLDHIDGAIMKATEGIDFVDNCCDSFVQTCIRKGKLWGFYHFANDNDPVSEADFFIDNCLGYIGHGVPVLDWEGNQNVDWVNRFTSRVFERTDVHPWIYANPWRFNQGGVDNDSMRWIAQYPNVSQPTFDDAENWEPAETLGLVGAWQFCSDGRVNGYDGDLDCSLFYGDEGAWHAYCGSVANEDSNADNDTVLENDEYKVTIERKI